MQEADEADCIHIPFPLVGVTTRVTPNLDDHRLRETRCAVHAVQV